MKNTMKKKPATRKRNKKISSGRQILDQADVSVPTFYASDQDIREEFLEMTRYTNNDLITSRNNYY